MFQISKENLNMLQQICMYLDTVEVRGHNNVGIIFQSITALKNIIVETEKNPIEKDGENDIGLRQNK